MLEEKLWKGIVNAFIGLLGIAAVILLLILISSCEKAEKNVCVLEYPNKCVAECYVPDENRTRDFYHYDPNTIHGDTWQKCNITCDTNLSRFMLYDCRDTQYENYSHYTTLNLR